MSLILPFTAPQAADLAVSGGKGANLARAAQSLPVPPGVIVTSAAYRAFIAPLEAQLSDLLHQHGQDHAACSAAIRAVVLAQPLSAALTDALAQALNEHGLANAALAVRSSGTLEDLPGAAFAGQHDTFLNVRGAPAVAAAVRACYASLWNERVLPYRERLGVNHLDAAMAVVIQSMVQVGAQEAAGVAFSIDPVQGKLDQVLINAAFGLGETVVAGEAPVDEFRVARDKEGAIGAILSRHIADKPEALVGDDDGGGTRSLALPAAQRTQSALTDAQCAEVARLALAAEQHFSFPQDIEWGYSTGRLYLLQSRAVTRIPARWTRDESAERFPNVVTPMTWDLVEEGFHASLNYSFALMGLPHFGDKWFAMRDYTIYGNQNAVDLYGGRLPVAALKDLGSLQAALPQIASQYAWVQELPMRWMRDLDTYLLSIGALMRESLDTKTLAEQWAYVLRVRDLGREYFLPNIAISLTQRMLYALLQYLLKMFTGDAQQAQTLFDRLLASTDTKTTQVNGELWALSRLIHHDPRLNDALQAVSSRQFLGQLHDHPAFAKAFAQLLQRHGHRELDFDAYHPTWLEAPQTVLDQLKVLAARADEDRRARELDAKVLMVDTEHALLARVPDALRYLVQEIIRLARAYTALDDLEHYQTTRLTLP
ncbi:MAG: phosphoenolpyruvate synthase, partial [Rhodanobacter sp.]|nr:phosphoenolpyruvate synthase [Rhodanobacter sp.]